MATGRRLFLQQGISATSMEQIAEETPVSKMTIYNYFGSKEGLLEQVVDGLIEEGYALFRKIMDEAADPMDALESFYRQRNAIERDISGAFLHELNEQFPELTARMLAFNRDRIMPEFERIILRGQQLGQLRKDISPHVLIQFISCMKEFMLRSDMFAGAVNANTVSEQLMTILYHGIVAPKRGDA